MAPVVGGREDGNDAEGVDGHPSARGVADVQADGDECCGCVSEVRAHGRSFRVIVDTVGQSPGFRMIQAS